MVAASLLLAVLLAGSLVYCAITIVAARVYLRQPALGRGEVSETAISVLKPLSGADLGLEENLRSFFDQAYGNFEILAAVRDSDDAAVPIFEKLQAEYSHVDARLVVTGEPPYANAKVYSLSRMLAAARHDLLIMSDSDIRVRPGTLRAVAAEFADPRIALASCPYAAISGPSLWSRLEALGMNTEFLGGLLVARLLMGVDFAIGPTIVARRSVLDHVPFDTVKDYLAEDFVLGKFASEAGLGVILSRNIVEHRIGSEPFLPNISHRLRWARSTRRSRPLGYLGQVFMNPLPLAFLLSALHPAWWPVLIPAVVLCGWAA
ncbi:MAG: glycosyltransferase, partial [Acidobacteriaceae bacterium]|nr:glycosyltransferase [Acidobacteriaceae bacterium]